MQRRILQVVWTRRAAADAARIYEFNLTRNEEWARRIDRRLAEGGDSLASLPLRGRLVAGTNQRVLSLVDVQYVVTYRVEDEEVRIIGVRSTREATK